MATVHDVKEMMRKLDKITGMNGASIPVKTSNTTRTLASFVFYNCGKVVGIQPVRFEFSKVILSCNEETLWEIVKHEYSHYVANTRHKDNCHHDYRFKEVCEEIGASANEPTFSNADLRQAQVKMAKYVVTCRGCGSVSTFSRMCNTLRAIDNHNATCCKCGGDDFHIKTNR